MVSIRYLDAPRADPTATEALRHLTDSLVLPARLVKRPVSSGTDPKRLTATIAECLHAKGLPDGWQARPTYQA